VATDQQTSEDLLKTHLSVYLAAGGQVLVATLDSHVVGFVLARTVGPLLWAATPACVIDLLFVMPDARRRGVGRALVGSIAEFADQAQSPYVYANVASGDRRLHRFLAGLGFGPAAGHRVVATATLLRKLAQEPAFARTSIRRDATRASIDDVIARRRRAREASAR
jgi:GNAT superfamily N-acetyltransferase